MDLKKDEKAVLVRWMPSCGWGAVIGIYILVVVVGLMRAAAN